MNNQPPSSEQRQEYRLNSHETVFIELASASHDGQQPEEILVSQSVDISANGLQVLVNQPLEMNRILPVAVSLEDLETPINLITEVKWIIADETNEQWMVGLALLESDDTRLGEWKHLIAQRLLDTPE
ncbi:MAG: pilus assembly protein PilZ [Cellvibrionaceae bacterium]|nr:pilus assembly protein PilZ [Cellvibrionaceae bacterium]|tara:strand:+ start:209166 stop:209549 length:384 start_codon:yes stop_codon:yes gene_type:complete